jgi:hypothetical protein
MVLTLAGNVIISILGAASTIVKFTAGPVPIKMFIFYIKLCFITSFFISLFLMGGIVTPLVGIIYMYYIFYKRLKCWNNNIPENKCVI